MPTAGRKPAAEPGAGAGEQGGQARGRLSASRVREELQSPSCWTHCGSWVACREMWLTLVGDVWGDWQGLGSWSTAGPVRAPGD